MLATYMFAHYILPGHSNNHKAKLIHSSTIFFFILSFMAYQLVLQFVPSTGVKVLGYAANIPSSEVVNLVNQKRTESGLPVLVVSESLTAAAKAKGEHMLANNYWAHIAPDGTDPWSFFRSVGYDYRYAGENLARDFSTPSSTVDAWVASPSHRENMLSSKYTDTGIAVVEGDLNGVDTTIIVQFFGTKLTGTSAVTVADLSAVNDTTEEVPIKVTPIPTVEPSIVPVAAINEPPNPPIDPQGVIAPLTTSVEESRFLISPFSVTRGLSLSILVTLLAVLVIDGVVVSRKRLPRIGGRTFAHVSFLAMIFAVAVFTAAGQVL